MIAKFWAQADACARLGSNQMSISFNNNNITDIYIGPNHNCKTELEMLLFKKDKDYYLAFGLPNGNTSNMGDDTLINFFIPPLAQASACAKKIFH